MITKINLQKINGYINIANRGGYIIWGTDGLKGYTHKLYLILYREDFGKTIEKTINRFSEIPSVKLNEEEFNEIVGSNNCKLLAIKNKGISEQVINILRGENGR